MPDDPSPPAAPAKFIHHSLVFPVPVDVHKRFIAPVLELKEVTVPIKVLVDEEEDCIITD